MHETNQNPAQTVAELAGARQHQKPAQPSWSPLWEVPLSSGPRTRADPSREFGFFAEAKGPTSLHDSATLYRALHDGRPVFWC